MLRKKSIFVIIFIVAVIFVFIGIKAINILLMESTITINNNTNIGISGLEIGYSNLKDTTGIPFIPHKQIFETKLIFPEDFSEGSIKLIYKDIYGSNHEEYIEGYIEKGYKEKINVYIDSVDSKGILSIRVNVQRVFPARIIG